jgi:hypothetical protein
MQDKLFCTIAGSSRIVSHDMMLTTRPRNIKGLIYYLGNIVSGFLGWQNQTYAGVTAPVLRVPDEGTL